MKRLSVQIYLTIIGSLLLVLIGASIATRIVPNGGGPRHALELVGELIAPALPPASSAASVQQAAIERLYRTHRLDLTLYDSERREIASVGKPMPVPRAMAPSERRHSSREGNSDVSLVLITSR